MIINQFPDRTIQVDNQQYLYFGGTSYLGLPTNKEFQKILIANLKKWGTAYGSSRNANIQLTCYDDAEIKLANFIQSEAALTISSGMLAGKIVIEQLIESTTTFFHFPETHTAIKAPNSLPFFVDGKINSLLTNSKKETIIVLTDAVPTSKIEAIDLSVLDLISDSKQITLVVDESHSLGILGINGCGIFSKIRNKNLERIILTSSLGKAFGITGGVIASDLEFITQIKKNASYASAAGMNPGFAQSISDTPAVYLAQHLKLQSNLKYISKNLKPNPKIEFSEKYPLLYPKIKEINQKLKDQNIIITNFEYPNETGYLNRIVITAKHTKKDLKKLITALNLMT
jgi:7-keto-8-aminopelargonate synthetase-like enzyme